jgi:hypothetical protein
MRSGKIGLFHDNRAIMSPEYDPVGPAFDNVHNKIPKPDGPLSLDHRSLRIFWFCVEQNLLSLFILTICNELDLSRQIFHASIKMYRDSKMPELINLVKKYASGKPIYVLSTSISPSFALVNQSGAYWPYHFPSL